MKKKLTTAIQIAFIGLFVLMTLTVVFYEDISLYFLGQDKPQLSSAAPGEPGDDIAESNSGNDIASEESPGTPLTLNDEKTSAEENNNNRADGLKEALFYKTMEALKVQCQMCFRKCTIAEGKRGFCKSRENIQGKLYTLTYAKPAAVHIDPVEKIPFTHFHPGTDALSIGTATCNFRCLNCINWQFAWKTPEEVEQLSMSPEEVIKTAKDNDLKTICFTYNEPTTCYEYMLDVFKLAKKEGLRTVYHTCGSMNPEPFETLAPFVDAVVVDLKGFDDEFYEENCSAELQPVLDYLKTVKKHGVWLEVVNLVIPGKNDSPDTVRKMCQWYMENLGPDVPLQFSRFFPTNQLSNLPPTPVLTLENACAIATEAGIRYVYIGNVSGHEKNNTYCPECGHLLIERVGLSIRTFDIEDGKCKHCGNLILGKW